VHIFRRIATEWRCALSSLMPINTPILVFLQCRLSKGDVSAIPTDLASDVSWRYPSSIVPDVGWGWSTGELAAGAGPL